MTNKVNKRKSLGSSKILFTIISILLGLFVGALVLVIAGFDPIEGFKNLFLGVFKSPRNMGWAIVTSTPIIMTGLGVAFAFKTGLFNMGAEGQFIIGTIVAFLVGYNLNLPPVLLPIVAIVLAMLIGAIYGAIAGFVKAKFGIHEVISTIMLNWIAFYFQNFVVYRFRQPNSMSSFDVADNAKITLFTDAAKRFDGFFSKFFRAPIHWGTIIAIVAVIIVWYILNKTTLGYELKAVGLNREASEYGGINAGNKIIQSMAISGAICSLAGVTQVLGFTYNLSILSSMQNFGFDGLAVSLLASNNPIGVIFSGLFFGSLKYAGGNLQRTMGVPSEIISIIIGTIILFTAVPLVFRIIKAKMRNKKSQKGNEKTAVDMSYVNKEIEEEKKEEL
ncbi:MAG: ABC transporter permease [Anaerococcus sp.]|uniref:ABC transporter permease n=1 Tax=Anaerococcus sp. TaxID=1872515 RepID=UPI00260B8DDA|nr:ABC transporter permease [Anaerococcus sp.]MCI5971824.1 ABC transporter permease [Anaerococcus sp.]MDD6918881.1 ABC transporter permease [Peptoniphilaceae bacterium]MDY2928374.1 ABC transporter permease [Anaerococcus sp.]